MPTNPATDELRDRLDGLMRYRKEHLTGDEKGDAAQKARCPRAKQGIGASLVFQHDQVDRADDQLPDPTTYFQNPAALWVVQQQTHAWLNRFEPRSRGERVLTDDCSMIEVWSDRVERAGRRELHAFFGPDGGSW